MTPTPQTATVSDEAVQVALNTWYGNSDYLDFTNMRKALTAAYPHLAISAAPCSVEVKDILATLDECWEYFDNKADVEDDANGPIANAELHLLTQVKEAHKALSATLSQIVTNPVDVAAVRRAAFSQGLEAAARYHNHEAEYYEARHGDKDGVPFPIVAGWHRLDAQRVRALSPAELVDQWQDEDHTSAARLKRLLTVCHGLRWTDVGVLALDNESTQKSLNDLSGILFMDGIAEAISERTLSPAPTSTGGA